MARRTRILSLALLALAAPPLAALPIPQASPRGGGQERPAPVPARAGESELAWRELDRLLIERHAMSDPGREALKHLLRARVLDRLALESRLQVSDAEVQARWAELEAEIASAEGSGLEAYLRENRIEAATFREYLRLAVVQERLARRALGIPAGRPVPGEQQEMWLDQVMEGRGVSMPAPPYADGVAAHCGDVQVSAADFAVHLRTQLPADAVRQDCYQLLLLDRVRERMPDVSPEAVEKAVEAELARRRAEFAADPRYQGVAYEQMVAAQGRSVAALPRDPAVRIAALAQIWVDRTHGEAGLAETYRSEREWFDGHFGEAVETRVLYLRAARLTNQLNPRSFEEAERELRRLASSITSAEEFSAAAGIHSEDPASRDRGGRLGFVTRADERVPEEIRAAAFAPASSDEPAAQGAGRLAGPIRIQSGAVLLWLGERRPTPPWSAMREHVHRELRRRFLDEVLREEDVVTFLDER